MRSIHAKMSFFILVTILLISLLLGGIHYRFSYQAMEREMEGTVERLARERAQQLSLLIQLKLKDLEGLAARDRVRSMDWNLQVSSLKDEMERQGYLAIAVVDENGIARYVDGYTLLLGDRPYVQQALEGESAMSEVILSRATETPVIMLSTHILTADGSPAALIARMDGQLLTELTRDTGFETHGYAYLLTREGNVLAHDRSPEYVAQQRSIHHLAQEDPALASFYAFAVPALESGSGVGAYQLPEGVRLAGYHQVPRTDWVLFVTMDRQVAMAGISALQQQIILTTLLVLAAGLFASLLLARHFSYPVILLERLFTRAASGDLTVRAELKTRDEIGKAAASFNQMMERINQLTYYDSVTDLPNQRVLAEEFREETRRRNEANTASYHPSFLSLLVMSPDHFRRINDQYGYATGDHLFRMAARRLQIYSGSSCRIYRGQSDEFILLCSDFHSTEQVMDAAHLLLQKLQDPYPLNGEGHVSLTFSTGMAFYPKHGDTVEELVKNAGFAKNMARDRGVGLLQLFDAALQHQILESRELEAMLPDALKNEQFRLEFQPIVSLTNGKIMGMETLIRWDHPEKGSIPPGLFIPAAERSGIIGRIGTWVLSEACRQYQEWLPIMKEPVTLTVNLSARQFEAPEFFPYLRHILQKTGMDPRFLELELTESAVIQHVSESIETLQRLREMGLRIAIDDFGTGYSSLSYVVRLPIDTLKIDRSFISDMTHNRQARSIVSTLIAMGHALNLRLVAEGIETEEQLLFVRKESCHLAQGYFFSPPVRPDSMEQLLRQDTFAGKLPPERP